MDLRSKAGAALALTLVALSAACMGPVPPERVAPYHDSDWNVIEAPGDDDREDQRD